MADRNLCPWTDVNPENAPAQRDSWCLTRRRIAPNLQLGLLITWRKRKNALPTSSKRKKMRGRTECDNADGDSLDEIDPTTPTGTRGNGRRSNGKCFDCTKMSRSGICSAYLVGRHMQDNDDDKVNVMDEIQVGKERTAREEA